MLTYVKRLPTKTAKMIQGKTAGNEKWKITSNIRNSLGLWKNKTLRSSQNKTDKEINIVFELNKQIANIEHVMNLIKLFSNLYLDSLSLELKPIR